MFLLAPSLTGHVARTLIRAAVPALFLASGVAAQTIKLNGPLPFGRSSVAFDLPALSADGSRVVYLGRSNSPYSRDLYSIPASGNEPPTRLGGPIVVVASR